MMATWTRRPRGTNAEAVTTADVAAVRAALLPTVCPGDTNGDGIVNFADLNTVLARSGRAARLAGDVNDDGVVNFADLNVALELRHELPLKPRRDTATSPTGRLGALRGALSCPAMCGSPGDIPGLRDSGASVLQILGHLV